MTLQQQALEMAAVIEDWDELPHGEPNRPLPEYIEEELRKAFRAGQAAALERKGIQPALDITQEVSAR